MTKDEKRAQRAREKEAESEAKEERGKSLDLLRQLRAEIQDLQALLRSVRDGSASLKTYASYVDDNRSEIEEIFKRIPFQPVTGDVAEGDDKRHIHNQWQLLSCSPIIKLPASSLSVDEQVKEIAMCDQFCQEIVACIGRLTIPARLNDWLKGGWNGYLLPFHDLFADELPRPKDRQTLLKVLAATPGIIEGGIVEPASGLIFPYHHHWYSRWAVCLALMLGFLAATIGIWYLGHMPFALVTGGSQAGDLVLNWLLVAIGLMTHYAVDRSKGSGEGGVKAIPLGHPAYVIDARAGSVLLKGLLMLLGFGGLLFLVPGERHGHLDFFLVGYSLDSFVGIVSSSLDKQAAARGSELAKQMKG
jgi:hypothetical protein